MFGTLKYKSKSCTSLEVGKPKSPPSSTKEAKTSSQCCIEDGEWPCKCRSPCCDEQFFFKYRIIHEPILKVFMQ